MLKKPFAMVVLIAGLLLMPSIYADNNSQNSYSAAGETYLGSYPNPSYTNDDSNIDQESVDNNSMQSEEVTFEQSSKERFSGFYLGAGAAYNKLNTDYSSDFSKPDNSDNAESTLGGINSNQFGGVVKAGYGYQFSNNLYLGLEYSYYPLTNSKTIDYTNSTQEESAGYSATFERKNLMTLTLTPGYVFKNFLRSTHDLLLKLELGASYASYRFDFIQNRNLDEENNQTKEKLGYVAGLGGEIAINENLSLFVSYKYLFQDSITYNSTAYPNNNYFLKPSGDTIEIGLNWRF